ncbi:MAG: hypothetical protein H6546_07005 [Chitinophagales bacterium]|nr:hypothetical protein [Chitinophagales bacterium]
MNLPPDLTPSEPFEESDIANYFTPGIEVNPSSPVCTGGEDPTGAPCTSVAQPGSGIWESPIPDPVYMAILMDHPAVDLFPSGYHVTIGIETRNDVTNYDDPVNGSPA